MAERRTNIVLSAGAVMACVALFAGVAWWRGGGLLLAVLGSDASPASKLVAVVHASDGTVERLPLGEDAVRTYETELGLNVVEVKGGAVRILEADCANQVCVQEGAISQAGEQLVCLPHRFSVEVVATDDAGPDGFDTVSR